MGSAERGMIRFECGQCGGAVRVPDACAGRKGLCPACGAVVSIPGAAKGVSEGDDAAIAELTAAVGRGAEDALRDEDAAVPPPPRPAGAEPSIEDEFDLPEPSAGAADETKILPAEESAKDEEARVDVRPSPSLNGSARGTEAAAPRRDADLVACRRRMIVAIAVAAASVITLVAVLLLRCLRII